MRIKPKPIVAFLTAAPLVVVNFNAACARTTLKPHGNVRYWKRMIVTHRFNGAEITTLTYYSTDPHGPIMSEALQHGKMSQFLLAPNGMSGLLWDEAGNSANLDFFSVVKLVKLRSQQIGYAKVKKLSGWPADIHPFVASPHFRIPAPPRFYASEIPKSVSSLQRVGASVFEGHQCLILQQPAIKLGSAGNIIDRFWWDVHTHYIWKEEDTNYPAPNSPKPPSRQVTYVKWVRPVKRSAVDVFRFPAGTRVVVPGILGKLPVPPGGIKIKPQGDSSAYLGLSFTAQLRYLESVKGTKNEVHFYKPGHVPKHP